MKGMREGMKPVMWAVAIAFVASLFFVGASTMRKIIRQDQGPAVVVVDGKRINEEEFNRVYLRELRMRYKKIQEESKRALTEQEERDLRISAAGAALNQIVQRELILREARRLGLRVTDEEIADYIQRNPNFMTGERFDAEVYERYVNERLGITPGEFEEQLRDYLLMERVLAMVGAAARVSEADAKAKFDEQYEKITVEFAVVPAAADVGDPTDTEVKAYYSSHLDKYRVGRRARIRYAFLDLAAERKKLNVSDADAKAYYEKYKNVHFDAGEIRVRHILFMVPPGSDERDWEAKKKQAEAALARARAGEDFGALAAQLSEDPGSAKRGGDVGWFAKGRMDPDFEAAAFAAREGEIVGPVKTIYGWHVIKREKDVPDFDDEKDNIKKLLLERTAEENAMNVAMDLKARLAKGKSDLAAEAQALGLKVVETQPFAANEAVPELGFHRNLIAETFTLAVGEYGSVQPIGDVNPTTGEYNARGFVVYQVSAFLEPGPAPLERIKGQVVADYKRDMALDRVRPVAEAVATSAKKNGDLRAAAAAAKVAFFSPPPFSRGTPPQETGFDMAFILAAFRAKPGEVVGPVRGENGYYVIKVLEKTPPDPALYATRGDEFRARLTNMRQEQITSEWYRGLVARAKIENNLSAFIREMEKGGEEKGEGQHDLPGGWFY